MDILLCGVIMVNKVRRSYVSYGRHIVRTTLPSQRLATDPIPVKSIFRDYAAVRITTDDVQSGIDDPAWRQKIAAGVSVNHIYSRNLVQIREFKPYSVAFLYKDKNLFNYANGWEFEQLWGSTLGSVGLPTTPSSTAVNQALSSFVSKATNYVSPFQGGTFLGELMETIHTIRHPCQGVKKLISSYLTGLKKARPGFKKATNQRRARFLANQWLEVSYGLKPLLSDIKSACDALGDIVNQRSNSPAIKGFGRDATLSGVTEFNEGAHNGSVTSRGRSFAQTKCVVYGAVRMDLNSPSQFALDKLGLSLPQFLPTVWELIPYSFLADYFTNVGQIVQAVSFPTSRLAYAGMSTVTRGRAIYDMAISAVPQNSAFSETLLAGLSPGRLEVEAVSMTRSGVSSFVPSLSVHIPSGVGQWTNMLALAVQAKSITPY